MAIRHGTPPPRWYSLRTVCPGPRRHHADVEVGARLDQREVHIEAVREEQRRALLHVGSEVVRVDVGLQLVRRQHHNDVGPLGGVRHLHDLELLALGLFTPAEVLRSATATFLMPESRRSSARAWPWLP